MASDILASYLPYLLDGACMIVGTFLLFTGVLGTFISVPKLAEMYGLGSATPETWVLMPAATGRNLGAGIFVWTTTLLGEQKVLGIFLICWTWAGIADMKVLHSHPKGEEANIAVNIRLIGILGILGALLICFAP